MRRFALHRSAVLALVLAAALGSPVAAQEQARPGAAAQPESDAKALFLRGLDAMLREQHAEALQALEQSYALQPSPNSGLLMARCLRKLGRLSEAAKRYQITEAEARARIEEGEDKYVETAESAATEGAEVRAEVGTIRLHVENAPSGTIIAADGRTQPLPEDGRLTVFHPPGDAVVVVQPPRGNSTTLTVELTAGQEAFLHANLEGAVASRQRAWALPAAIAAGGVGVLGIALFTGFSVSSQGTYDDLSRECAPSCQDRQDEVEAADRDQTIGNVSLAVGLVGLAAGGAFAALWLTAPEGDALPGTALRIGVGVGAGSVRVHGTF